MFSLNFFSFLSILKQITQEINEDLKIQLLNSNSNNKFLKEKISILEKKLDSKSKSTPFTGVNIIIFIIFFNVNTINLKNF